MSYIVAQDNHWRHYDGIGNVTIVERDQDGYFVPGFYGEGVPRFATLQSARIFIDMVQGSPRLPANWDTWSGLKILRKR